MNELPPYARARLDMFLKACVDPQDAARPDDDQSPSVAKASKQSIREGHLDTED